MKEILQSIISGLFTGCVYGMVALGIALVYKSSGVFNFAQGEFGTVGIFFFYLGTTWGLPYGFAILFGLLVSVLMGIATERLVIQPLYDAARVTLLVATAGVALLAIGTEFWIGGAIGRPLTPIFAKPDRLTVVDVFISDQDILTLAILAGLAIGLGLFFSRSSLGLAVLAASQEPTATNLMGISVRRLSTLVWGLAGLLGGLAAILSATKANGFTPAYMTQTALIPGFTAAVIGGMTSLPGAFLGGFIVGVAQTLASRLEFFEFLGPGPGPALIFILLLAVLLARPQGLLGKRA